MGWPILLLRHSLGSHVVTSELGMVPPSLKGREPGFHLLVGAWYGSKRASGTGNIVMANFGNAVHYVVF